MANAALLDPIQAPLIYDEGMGSQVLEAVREDLNRTTARAASAWPENPPPASPDLAQGAKADGGKDRWDLLSWPAIRQVVKVLTFGAAKYEAWNWAKGINYSRVRAALQRHLVAWDDGNNTDPETGLHHLAHAGCCLMFLLTYELFPRRYAAFDDRYQWEEE